MTLFYEVHCILFHLFPAGVLAGKGGAEVPNFVIYSPTTLSLSVATVVQKIISLQTNKPHSICHSYVSMFLLFFLFLLPPAPLNKPLLPSPSQPPSPSPSPSSPLFRCSFLLTSLCSTSYFSSSH